MADRRSMLVVEKGIPELRVIPLEQQVYWLVAFSSAEVFIDNSYVLRMHAHIVEEAGPPPHSGPRQQERHRRQRHASRRCGEAFGDWRPD